MNTTKTEQKPLYKHDCDDCVFLGSYKNKDLYFCKEKSALKNQVCIIIRNSDEPSDYFSMPSDIVKVGLQEGAYMKNSPLDECYKRYLNFINK